MAGRLKAYGRCLFSPVILFLICHESLLEVAEDVADLLEDACDYHKITSTDALITYFPLFQETKGDEGRPRVIIMPNIANSFENRVKLFRLFAEEAFPAHYVGALALTESIDIIKTLTPGKFKCEPVKPAERGWFLPEFTCVIDSLQEIDILKRFIAMALPDFI